MKMTSAEAAKKLKELKEKLNVILMKEQKSETFVAAVSEDPESVRPVYDYEATRKEQEELEKKIRLLKHAVSEFNLSKEVPGFQMTVDQLLIYIPQLTQRKNRLSEMADRLPKSRTGEGSYSNIIDYTYANYDIEKAAADYAETSEELSRAQMALDLINTTEMMDVPE